MLKAAAKMEDGKTLLVLGLSHTNLRRLGGGEPILLKDLSEFDLPEVAVMIFSGETEEKMAADLQQFVGPETTVHVDPRLFGGSD